MGYGPMVNVRGTHSMWEGGCQFPHSLMRVSNMVEDTVGRQIAPPERADGHLRTMGVAASALGDPYTLI